MAHKIKTCKAHFHGRNAKTSIFRFVLLIIIVTISAKLFPSFHVTPHSGITTLWTFTTNGEIESSPAVADVDGDGKPEIIIGSEDRNVYALNGEDGSLLWNFTTGCNIESSPAVADVDGDGKPEIIIGSSDAKIYVLNGEDGSLLWNFTTGNAIWSSPVIEDINDDGQPEILIGSWDHKIYALNGKNGTPLWTFTTGEGVASSPAVGDINRDGLLEVVIGSHDKKVYALNGKNGSLLWNFTTGDGIVSSPTMADVDGDGKPEIIIGGYDDKIYALNGEDGSLLWVRMTGYIKSSPAVGDIDGDGKLEIIISGGNYKIYALNGEDGSFLWTYETGNWIDFSHWIISSAAIGDVNGDNRLDVIVGSWDGNIYVLNGRDGSLLWKYTIGVAISSSPVIADINKDGKLEIVIGAMDNKVYVFSCDQGKRIYWEGFAGGFGEDYSRTRCLSDVDRDGDMISDYSEQFYSTDPGNADSDRDGMPDGWEVYYALNPLKNDAMGDPDNDLIPNLDEYLGGTDPRRYDIISPATGIILGVIIGVIGGIIGMLIRRRLHERYVSKHGYGLAFYRKYYKNVQELDDIARKIAGKKITLETVLNVVTKVSQVREVIEYMRDKRIPKFNKKVIRYYDQLCAEVLPRVSNVNIGEIAKYNTFADAKILIRFIEEAMAGKLPEGIYSEDELTDMVKEIAGMKVIDPLEVCKKGHGIYTVMEALRIYRSLGKEISVKGEKIDVFGMIDDLIEEYSSEEATKI